MQSMHVINQTHHSGWPLFFFIFSSSTILPGCCFDESVHFKSAIQMWVHLMTVFFCGASCIRSLKSSLGLYGDSPPSCERAAANYYSCLNPVRKLWKENVCLTVRYGEQGGRRKRIKRHNRVMTNNSEGTLIVNAACFFFFCFTFDTNTHLYIRLLCFSLQHRIYC